MSATLALGLLGGALTGLTQTAEAAPGDLAFGVVTVDANKNNVVDTGAAGSNDLPVAGVTMTLKGSNPAHPGWTTTTKADGSWSFPASADYSASPGPFTVTLNADKVNGDGYLTPTATSDANDFTRFGGDPQVSVSAPFSAGTPVQLDALVYPAWSIDLALTSDARGYQGLGVFTGTAPFAGPDTEPGMDTGTNNDRVRSGDIVSYSWSITSSSEQAVGQTYADQILEQSLKPGTGAVINFDLIPGVCDQNKSYITAVTPTGNVKIPARVDPPTGATEVILTCNLGAKPADSSARLLTTNVFVSSSSTNGSTYETTARAYAVAPTGEATAQPSEIVKNGPITITSAPRYDVEKIQGHVDSNQSMTIDGKQVTGFRVYYTVMISTDRKVGVETFKDPIQLEESLWALQNQGANNGQPIAGMKWYIDRCTPSTGVSQQYQNIVFGKIGLNGGTAANSVSDSGTCAFTRTNTADATSNYTLTFSDIDTSGASYPTQKQNGASLAAGPYYVASYLVSAFIPFEEVDKTIGGPSDGTGSLTLYNRVGNFDPTGLSGASNFGSGFEPGYCAPGPNTDQSTKCALMEDGKRSNNVAGPTTVTISPGDWAKAFLDMTASYGYAYNGIPNNTGYHAGAGQVQPGQTFTSQQSLNNTGVSMTNIQMCDVWDNTVLKLVPLTQDSHGSYTGYRDPYSSVGYSRSGQGQPTNAMQETFDARWDTLWATVDLTGDNANLGEFDAANNRWKGDWSKQRQAASGTNTVCGKTEITWYTNINDVPGGPDAVNAAWVRTNQNEVVEGNTSMKWSLAFQQRDTYKGGPHNGQAIPSGTVAANFGSVTSSTMGAWKNNDYVPGAGLMDGKVQTGENGYSVGGDRWTVTRADMSLQKRTIAGTIDGVAATGVADFGKTATAVAGKPVIWEVVPTVTADSAQPAPVQNVVITDTLPNHVIYDEAATLAYPGATPPTSFTVNANGTTTLVWRLGEVTPNTTIAPLKIVTIADPMTPARTSVTNKATISADSIPAVSKHTDDHTITIDQAGELSLKKSVDRVLDLQDDEQNFTLQVRNFSEQQTIKAPTVIDVLPCNGDATNTANVNRSPGSDFEGTNVLKAAPQAFEFDGKTPVAGTFYYTTVPGAQVPQHLSNDTSAIWTPTFSPQATAFKFVATNELSPMASGSKSGITIKFTTDQAGNEAGDLYSNRFTAFSSSFMNSGRYQLLSSNLVTVRVLGFSIGDLIWFDNDDNGTFDAGVDTLAPEGVKVEVYDKANTLVGTATTNDKGRWLVNDLPRGEYYAVIPASEFAADGPLAGYVVQPVGLQANPNTDKNEWVDHHAIADPDRTGAVRTSGLTLLDADTTADPIKGLEPLEDNNGGLVPTPGTTDAFTNFTVDMALKPVPGYTFTKTANPATGTAVQAGSTITYTLKGSNTGKTPLNVVVTDDLSKVLDFAEITTAPAATIAGAASVPPVAVSGTDLSWEGVLQPGQSVEITYTVTVGEGHEGATINNRANSTATPPTGPPITPPEVVTEHPIPGYAFTKTAEPVSGSAVTAGSEIAYTLTGTNTGATVLDPVEVTDDLAEVLAYAELVGDPAVAIVGDPATTAPELELDGTKLSWRGKLEVGQKVVITYTVKVAAGHEGKIVNNKAVSQATPPGLPPITPPEVTTEHPIPGYTFTKVADPKSTTPVAVGGTITYTLTGTNTGATVLEPVVVNDDLTEVLKFAAVSSAPVASINGAAAGEVSVVDGKLSWSGALKVGESVTITYTVKVKEGSEGGTLRNKAVSEATPPGLPPIKPPEVVTEHPVPGYVFSKTADPKSTTPVKVGETITYTLTGTNTGATVLSPVVVNDDLTEVLKFAAVTSAPEASINGAAAGEVSVVDGKLSWSGALKVGESVTITYTVKVKEGSEGGTLRNKAVSEATPPGLPPIKPPEVVTEHPVPGYVFSKTADPKSTTPVKVGETITYTLTGTNTGATVLSPVKVSDDLSEVLAHATLESGTLKAEIVKDGVATEAAVQPTISGSTLTWSDALQMGESVRITYTVKVNAGSEGETLRNEAVSEATPPGVPPITPPGVTTEHPVPGYTFTKVADPQSTTPVKVGETITYTLTGTNTGATVLDPVVVNDDLSEVLKFAAVTSAPAASINGAAAGEVSLVDGKLSWTGALKVGESVTITYTVKVKEGSEGGTLRNKAVSEATPPGLPPITPPEVTTEHPVPGYVFSKTADPKSTTPVKVGETITYTLLGENTGATVLDPVKVSDDLTQVLSFATVNDGTLKAEILDADGAATPADVQPVIDGTTLAWTDRLEIGQSVRITYTVTVNEGSEGETLRNSAVSEATPPGIPPITPPEVTTEHPVPGYTFTKVSDPESGTAVKPGGTITYTLTGTNTGATALDPVVIDDDLSKVLDNATLTTAPVASIEGRDDVPAPVVDGTAVAWQGDLQVGQSVVITYTVTLNDDAEGVIVNNHASSSATPPGVPPITPPEVETWHPTPGYTFTKTSDPVSGSTVVEGDVITYTLTGSNFGQTVLDPVVINDDLANVTAHATLQGTPVAKLVTADGETDAPVQPTVDGSKLTWSSPLEIGQQVVITYSVKVNEGQEGTIINNRALSSATPPGLPPVTPPEVVTEHPVPGYTFDKSADPASGSTVKVGDTITYTLSGANTGATVLDPVTVTDDLSQVVAYADLQGEPTAQIIDGDGDASDAAAPAIEDGILTWSGTLQVGEKVVITYKVSVNEGSEGKLINNRAHSEATPPGKPPVTPPEVTTEHPVPGYTLTKTADPVSGSKVERGGKITYMVTGTNTGATVLDPVHIADDLSKVLDQAELTGTPVAVIVSEDGTETASKAVVDGTSLTWDGSLEVGQKVIITYSVTVKADADATTINNRVTSTATPPGVPELTPPPAETTHEVPPVDAPPAPPGPRPPLPNVGGSVRVGLLAAALAGLAVGGFLMVRGRRRKHV